MSCLRYCDSDDCYENENDVKMYDMSYKLNESLAKFIGNNGDICQYCIDTWIEDYPNLMIKDDIYDYIMNPEFKEDK